MTVDRSGKLEGWRHLAGEMVALSTKRIRKKRHWCPCQKKIRKKRHLAGEMVALSTRQTVSA